jgi:putative ABC transport system permease protein
MALGAQQSEILKMVVSDGAKLALAGVVAGLAGSFALTRLMSGLLFGVSATDPVTLIAIALSLTGVSILASFFPARRAAKVNPIVALRGE